MTTDLTTQPNLPNDTELGPLLQESHAQSTRAQQAAAPMLAYDPATLTPEQDQQLADYLVRARRTLDQLRDRRAPLTRSMDALRARLVALEAPLDPKKHDSITARLQGLRDAYARLQLQAAYQGEAAEPVKAREQYEVDIVQPEAYVALLALYVERERPTLDKLQRLKLEQLVTWAEKLANTDGELLQIAGLDYVWSVRTVAR